MAPKNDPPPEPKKKDWTEAEKEFFEKHGITDDKEKQVIRGRANVYAYDRARARFESENEKPAANDDSGKKKWYED
jgi:hypothetical protein